MTQALPRFETLIEHHHDEIYAYLWRMLGSDGAPGAALDAQDLTQEVFMRAYMAFDRLRPDSKFRAWLYKIATHCAYTALRDKQRTISRQATRPDETSEGSEDPSHIPLQDTIHAETLAALREAVAGLPPAQKGAVVMRYLQALSYTEIAKSLGCSEESARANVSHALRRLRRELAAWEE